MNSNAIDSSSCCEDLIFPKCTENESIAIRHLIARCPAELRQIVLDEIEGARQACVIKTNLVPFTRGIMMAIARGTFTAGHGLKLTAKRTSLQDRPNALEITMDPETLRKGKAFIGKFNFQG